MVRHLDILGILFVLWGLFQAFIGFFILLVYGGLGAIMGAAGVSEGDSELMVGAGAFTALGLFVACLVGVFSIPNVLAGIGIRRRRKWARIAGIVFGALALTSIPFGTALGIYALVVLLDKEVGEAFDAAAAEAA